MSQQFLSCKISPPHPSALTVGLISPINPIFGSGDVDKRAERLFSFVERHYDPVESISLIVSAGYCGLGETYSKSLIVITTGLGFILNAANGSE